MPFKKIDALSDAAIRATKATGKRQYLMDGRGLHLEVTPQGERLWRLKFQFAGKGRMMGLGRYPDVPLAKARVKAAGYRGMVLDGIDPVLAKRETKVTLERTATSTFAVLADQWIAKKSVKWTEGHTEHTRQSLRDYVLPKLGKRPGSAIEAQDIVRVLQPLEDAGKLETLRRVRQRIGGVLSFAVQTGYTKSNPIRDMQGAFQAPEREHFASLQPQELTEFIQRLGSYQGHQNTLGIIWLILLCACRTGEARGAKAKEFDLDAAQWTVPLERMKKRRPHVFPLPSQAIELLQPALSNLEPDDLVFPSPGTREQMASENIVLQAITKMGFKGRLTGHGIRACVATSLEEMGYPASVVKAQLAHSKDNLTDAAYLRGVHLEPRMKMMQVWADTLDLMKQGLPIPGIAKASGNVRKFERAA